MTHDFPEGIAGEIVACRNCGLRCRVVVGIDFSLINPSCGEKSNREPLCTGPCPGDEYKVLTDTLGLQAKVGCQCEAIRRDMNQLGVGGCIDKRDELVQRLQANYAAHYSYEDLFAAARRAKKREAFKLLWKLRTLDASTAIERLFDLAVENARAKAS